MDSADNVTGNVVLQSERISRIELVQCPQCGGYIVPAHIMDPPYRQPFCSLECVLVIIIVLMLFLGLHLVRCYNLAVNYGTGGRFSSFFWIDDDL